MTRYLADFEVESHGFIPKEYGRLTFKHPNDLYEVQIKNLRTSPQEENALLSVQLIFEAEDFDIAYEQSRATLRKFFRYLTLVTSCTFITRRILRIIDWTPGLQKRRAHQILSTSDPNIPVPVIHPEFLESVSKLMTNEPSPELDRAMKWYAKGVAAPSPDEQFQFFWLAIELLGEIHKPPGKVPDRCPQCQAELYCKTCDEISMHKPYAKQAIESLIRQKVKGVDPQKLIEHFDKVRNTLFHGGDLEALESTLEISLEKLVNNLGAIVFAALISSFKAPVGTSKLGLATTNRYVHYEVIAKADIEQGMSGDPNNPTIEDIPGIKMELVVSEPEESNSNRTK